MTDTQALILVAIENVGIDVYGIPLADEIERLYKRMPTGELYYHLGVLEEKGFVISHESDKHYSERGNRARRYFTVTPKGKQELAGKKSNWLAKLEIVFGSV